MPSSPIISVKNIGKKYKLGATLGGRNYKTLRDVFTQAAFGPFQKLSAVFGKKPSTGGNHSSPNNPITQSSNNDKEVSGAGREAKTRPSWCEVSCPAKKNWVFLRGEVFFFLTSPLMGDPSTSFFDKSHE